jgi:uncharacterized protein YbaA (DUF1428 family)
MDCVDGFVAAVPVRNKEAFAQSARGPAQVLKEAGAKCVVECWCDDVTPAWRR